MIMIRTSGLPAGSKKKILIVDDSAIDRQLIIKVIRGNGYSHEILEARDGEEALRILSQNYETIGLICLDWQMPKMDGMEFMKGVIKTPQTASIPIVMVTASGSEEAKCSVRRINPKLAGYVVKPFQSEDFLQVVAPFLWS